MARSLGLEGGRSIHHRSRRADVIGPLCQRRCDVKGGRRHGRRLDGCRNLGGRAAPGLEGFQLDGQRPPGGLGDLRVQLGQLDGGEADLVGQRLAVDEGGIERRAHQRLGGLGRGLHEIAQHGVVADLHRHAALARQLGLQRGDDPATVVAQGPGLIQLRPHAFGHKPAVTREGRQVGAKARHQQVAEGCEIGEGRQIKGVQRSEGFGRQVHQRIAGVGEEAADRLAQRQAVAQGAQIARAAATERQPRQAARHIGQPFQRLTQPLPLQAALAEPGHGVQAGVDSGGVEQGSAQSGAEHPRARRRHRPVDGCQQRTFPRSGGGALDLQAGPGRRVDDHHIGFAGATRRRQYRNPARLGGFQMRGDQAQGGNLCTR